MVYFSLNTMVTKKIDKDPRKSFIEGRGYDCHVPLNKNVNNDVNFALNQKENDNSII